MSSIPFYPNLHNIPIWLSFTSSLLTMCPYLLISTFPLIKFPLGSLAAAVPLAYFSQELGILWPDVLPDTNPFSCLLQQAGIPRYHSTPVLHRYIPPWHNKNLKYLKFINSCSFSLWLFFLCSIQETFCAFCVALFHFSFHPLCLALAQDLFSWINTCLCHGGTLRTAQEFLICGSFGLLINKLAPFFHLKVYSFGLYIVYNLDCQFCLSTSAPFLCQNVPDVRSSLCIPSSSVFDCGLGPWQKGNKSKFGNCSSLCRKPW